MVLLAAVYSLLRRRQWAPESTVVIVVDTQSISSLASRVIGREAMVLLGVLMMLLVVFAGGAAKALRDSRDEPVGDQHLAATAGAAPPCSIAWV